MKKFNVTLEVTVRKRIQVEAKNEEEAKFAAEDGEGNFLELPTVTRCEIQQVIEVGEPE